VDPFRRPDSASEADLLTDAALAVMTEGGLAALSVSAMARWIGVTPPALTLR
jgi:AcrR family transcriptional regulator